MIDLSRFQSEQKAWSEYNFPNRQPRDPLEGLIEECGELAHARLKARQGIRGTPEQHLADEQDAACDMMIYLLDFANQNDHPIEPVVRFDSLLNPNDFFLKLTYHVGQVADMYRRHDTLSMFYTINAVASAICHYSNLRGWDFMDLLDATWSEVKARDWKKYPKTGRPPEGDPS